MCVRITFTRKPSFFEVSPCFHGHLELESWEPMQVDTGAWQPGPEGDAAPVQSLTPASCISSGLLPVWSLGNLHQNHLGCQFKNADSQVSP